MTENQRWTVILEREEDGLHGRVEVMAPTKEAAERMALHLYPKMASAVAEPSKRRGG